MSPDCSIPLRRATRRPLTSCSCWSTKILDTHTTDTGQPYFVMERVRGIKITDYCDQAKRTT